MKYQFLLLSTALFIASCGEKSKQTSTVQNKTDDYQNVNKTYKLNQEDITLTWEAYKFNERKGVKGTFDSISFTPKTEYGNLSEIIEGLSFEIDINSTNSGDIARDPKIIEFFFGTMLNTGSIRGTITSYDSTSDYSADATVDIAMNDKIVSVPAKITILSSTIKLKAVLDIANWDAMSALSNLDEQCDVLHKGADGVSKLWPDVMITVSATYSEAEET
jgi:hypothetical protein